MIQMSADTTEPLPMGMNTYLAKCSVTPRNSPSHLLWTRARIINVPRVQRNYRRWLRVKGCRAHGGNGESVGKRSRSPIILSTYARCLPTRAPQALGDVGKPLGVPVAVTQAASTGNGWVPFSRNPPLGRQGTFGFRPKELKKGSEMGAISFSS